jgi:hypothetical protein
VPSQVDVLASILVGEGHQPSVEALLILFFLCQYAAFLPLQAGPSLASS